MEKYLANFEKPFEAPSKTTLGFSCYKPVQRLREPQPFNVEQLFYQSKSTSSHDTPYLLQDIEKWESEKQRLLQDKLFQDTINRQEADEYVANSYLSERDNALAAEWQHFQDSLDRMKFLNPGQRAVLEEEFVKKMYERNGMMRNPEDTEQTAHGHVRRQTRFTLGRRSRNVEFTPTQEVVSRPEMARPQSRLSQFMTPTNQISSRTGESTVFRTALSREPGEEDARSTPPDTPPQRPQFTPLSGATPGRRRSKRVHKRSKTQQPYK